MNRPAITDAIRQRSTRVMLAGFPAAAAAQFVGDRTVAELVLSLVILAGLAVIAGHAQYRAAVNRLAWEAQDARDAAAEQAAAEEHAAHRIARIAEYEGRLAEINAARDARRAVRTA